MQKGVYLVFEPIAQGSLTFSLFEMTDIMHGWIIMEWTIIFFGGFQVEITNHFLKLHLINQSVQTLTRHYFHWLIIFQNKLFQKILS